MKLYLFILPFLILLASCGDQTEKVVLPRKVSTEWNSKNIEAFVSKCSEQLNREDCECIISNILDSGKDVVQIGELKQDAFLILAGDCLE